ncbi:hypothetical protein D3C73_1616930 [compost metagenome]
MPGKPGLSKVRSYIGIQDIVCQYPGQHDKQYRPYSWGSENLVERKPLVCGLSRIVRQLPEHPNGQQQREQ